MSTILHNEFFPKYSATRPTKKIPSHGHRGTSSAVGFTPPYPLPNTQGIKYPIPSYRYLPRAFTSDLCLQEENQLKNALLINTSGPLEKFRLSGGQQPQTQRTGQAQL